VDIALHPRIRYIAADAVQCLSLLQSSWEIACWGEVRPKIVDSPRARRQENKLLVSVQADGRSLLRERSRTVQPHDDQCVGMFLRGPDIVVTVSPTFEQSSSARSTERGGRWTSALQTSARGIPRCADVETLHDHCTRRSSLNRRTFVQKLVIQPKYVIHVFVCSVEQRRCRTSSSAPGC
jgi:hypothetical protein